jgi:hypothetical protein
MGQKEENLVHNNLKVSTEAKTYGRDIPVTIRGGP